MQHVTPQLKTSLVHFVPEKPDVVYRILLNVAKFCVTEPLRSR